jgi:hypothetical protein
MHLLHFLFPPQTLLQFNGMQFNSVITPWKGQNIVLLNVVANSEELIGTTEYLTL